MKDTAVMDNVNYGVSGAAILSVEWLNWIGELEGDLVQLLGIFWLVVQIYFKIKNKGR